MKILFILNLINSKYYYNLIFIIYDWFNLIDIDFYIIEHSNY